MRDFAAGRKPASPKKRRPAGYTYVPFRPGVELQARLFQAADKLGMTVSELVRTCCNKHLPKMEAK